MMKKLFSAAAVLTAALSAGAAGMKADFDAGFVPGELKGAGKFSGGTWTVTGAPGSIEVVSGGASGASALKVNRTDGPGWITLHAEQPVPAGNNARVSFKTKLDAGQINCLIVGKMGKPSAGVRLTGGASPMSYNEKTVWIGTGMKPVPAGEWVTIELNFNAQAGSYGLSMTRADGSSEISGIMFPILNSTPVADVTIVSCLPAGNSTLFDDIAIADLGKGAAAAGNGMSLGFDDEFNPGELKGTGKFSGGVYAIQAEAGTFEIVGEGASAPNALKINRRKVVGSIFLRPAAVVPATKDFTFSFKVKLAQSNGTAALVGALGQAIPAGAVSLFGGVEPKAYDAQRVWRPAGLPVIPPGQWVTVELVFDRAAASYQLAVVYPDGERKVGATKFPILNSLPVSEIKFINCVPTGSSALVDDIELFVR